MALDLLGTLKQIWDLWFTVKAALEKAGCNAEDCRRMGELLRRLDAMAERLQGTPGAMEDGSMRDTTEGLDEALRRASELVTKWQGNGFVTRTLEASDIADNLRGVCLDILLNLMAVLLAHGIYSTAEMNQAVAELRAEMKEAFAQLHTAYNSSMPARILQIVVTHPDVHLPKEVAQLVQDYHQSTESASSQNKNKRDTKKTDVARPEVKIQKSNKTRNSKVVPDASLLDGSAESASVASVTTRYVSSTIINKIISRSTKNMTLVTSIDLHPDKTWIVTGHEGGKFSIWDYQKQKTVTELQVNDVPGKAARVWHEFSQYFRERSASHSVCSVKFIAQNEWLVVGDGDGYVYIYDYTNTKLVKKFRAHHKSVDSLAVHPTEPYILSSSAFGRTIKLWDWSRDWVQIQEYDVKPTYPDGVRSLKFNPRDTNTFACVLYDNRVKVGNIKTSSLKTTLMGASKADYFFTRSHQQLMVTLRCTSSDTEIRDLETGKVVHTLDVSGRETSHIAFNPTLAKLVTMLDDGTVCLWDANTYRREVVVPTRDSKPRDLVFETDKHGLTRLVVTSERTIEIMEVNLPIANTSKQQAGSGNYG